MNRRFAMLVSLVVFAAGALFGYGVREWREPVFARHQPAGIVDAGTFAVRYRAGPEQCYDAVRSCWVHVYETGNADIVIDGDLITNWPICQDRASRRNSAAPTGEPK